MKSSCRFLDRVELKTFVLLHAILLCGVAARDGVAQLPPEQAWQQLPQYEYGQDMAALLAIDRVVIDAMRTPAERAECAAHLARLLESPNTTLAAKQYICFQLRQIGTDAQVPLLARLLRSDDTSSMARYALESIAGDAARQALLAALPELKGEQLIGVVNSLGKRQEPGSVEALASLSASDEAAVRVAAWRALANIGDARAVEVLVDQVAQASDPIPPALAAPLLRCVEWLQANGEQDTAESFCRRLAQEDQSAAIRRAAWEGLLSLQLDAAGDTVSDWFLHGDPAQRRVAMGHLSLLSSEQLESVSTNLATLPTPCVVAVVELLAERDKTSIFPKVMQMADSQDPQLRLAAVRLLGALGDSQAVARLVAGLAADDAVAEAAKRSLQQLPRDRVGPALLESLADASLRRGVIDVLKQLRYYEAIDPLIELALEPDPATYNLAMDGLRGIADPDNTDLPRLLKLVLRVPAGAQRDEAEKTVVIVCDKQPAAATRLSTVRDVVAQYDAADKLAFLPLLGRLGDEQALEIVEKYMAGESAQEQEAAVRALCNWPDAKVADRLMAVVTKTADPRFRRWALRAYVRVVSLPSDRPEGETLAMLQAAMGRADVLEDRQLIIQRAGSVRSMESVNWIAQFLDQPDLAQIACQAVVELAHHRELRHPNMQQFGPLLERVAQLSRDPEVVERARRYRLGL